MPAGRRGLARPNGRPWRTSAVRRKTRGTGTVRARAMPNRTTARSRPRAPSRGSGRRASTPMLPDIAERTSQGCRARPRSEAPGYGRGPRPRIATQTFRWVTAGVANDPGQGEPGRIGPEDSARDLGAHRQAGLGGVRDADAADGGDRRQRRRQRPRWRRHAPGRHGRRAGGDATCRRAVRHRHRGRDLGPRARPRRRRLDAARVRERRGPRLEAGVRVETENPITGGRTRRPHTSCSSRSTTRAGRVRCRRSSSRPSRSGAGNARRACGGRRGSRTRRC